MLLAVLGHSSAVLNANFNKKYHDAAVTSGSQAAEDGSAANPIRKVVSLLQRMAKKVEEEGKREQELFDKFMCYCKNSGASLAASIADNDAQVPALQSDIEESESKLETTKQELAQHQKDRDDAKAAMAKATAVREKEHAAYLKESGELKVNVGALSKAVPAIEKGMSGGFLQTDAAKLIRRVALTDADLTEFDRDALTAFLEGGSTGAEEYVPKSGQIVGILKEMLDDFQKDLDGVEKVEADAAKTYDELMAAKTKEVETHTAAIERKTKLIGELSVEIVHMKNSLTDAEQALIEDKKFQEDLETNCATKKKEMDERVKTRSEELVAIADTIKILNDDDALDLFKKTLPSAAAGSLLQLGKDAMRKKRALSILRTARKVAHQRLGHHLNIDIVALALQGKKVDFSKVIKMIDDMVGILAKEQTDDDHKKEYCSAQLDFAEDKAKELKHSIGDLETTIEDTTQMIKGLTEELATLKESIVSLDASVLEATVQRKKENREYTEVMSDNTAAVELLNFAKNRLNKFYNPKLYKAPPKRELTEEEKIDTSMGGELEATPAPGGIAGTGVEAFFLQASISVHQHASNKDDPGPPPEIFEGGYKKKGEESGGVVAMVDLLIRDLEKEMTEAETEEKDAQRDYEAMMDDAAKKRADAVKSIAEKENAKADAEQSKMEAEGAKAAEDDELAATVEYEAQLHSECDWLIQNYDVRKEARAQEVDALKNAKATLEGADFSE
jgi:chromosome segregation ATPase